jgi:hypothetical protein
VKTENEFRKHIISVAQIKGHVSHVESHETSAGIPDLNIWWMGQDLWLELKVIKGGKVTMRPTQRKWHLDRAQHGGQSWVLVLDPENEDILVLPGDVAATLPTATRSWRAAAGVSNINMITQLLSRISRSQRK